MSTFNNNKSNHRNVRNNRKNNNNNDNNNNNQPDYNFAKYEHILSAFRMLQDVIIMCPECPKSGPRQAFSCEYDFKSHMKDEHLNKILDINLPSDILEVCIQHSGETSDLIYDNISSNLKSEINNTTEKTYSFLLSSSLSATTAVPDSQSIQLLSQSIPSSSTSSLSRSTTDDPTDPKFFVKSYERYGQIRQFNILIYKLPILKAAHAAYLNGTCPIDQSNIDKVRKWVINAVFNQLSTEYFQYAIPDYIAHLVCATIVCTYPVLQDDTSLKYRELYSKLLTKYANYRKRSQLQLSTFGHKKRNAPLQAIINAKKKRDDIKSRRLNNNNNNNCSENRIDELLLDDRLSFDSGLDQSR